MNGMEIVFEFKSLCWVDRRVALSISQVEINAWRVISFANFTAKVKVNESTFI